MSGADPLKSAISIRGADDTSLALPSANEYHSREQRVRAQVQSLRRTKSRHSSSGRSESSCLSPSSPEYDSVFLDGAKSSQLSSSNGSVFLSNGSSKVVSFFFSFFIADFFPFECCFLLSDSSNRSGNFNEFISQSYRKKGFFFCVGLVSYLVNGNSVSSNITMQEAVLLLSSKDEKLQNGGASYIQHNTFINDKAKEEVCTLNGIPPLVRLLQSPNSQVKGTASAALRNLTFQNNKNKEEIQRCDGIPEVVAQLRDSESAELDKQLTGLLWNLSSVDNLKSDLLKNALPVLMERVILPYTKGSRDTVSADVFCHATGCLRNLSSPNEASRQTMRKCRGLIDGLFVSLRVHVCVMSPGVCVCVTLHNLTFHLEEEFSSLFININSLAKNMMSNASQNNTNSVGCFNAQSKPLQSDRPFDYAVIEDPQPNGAGLLIHSKTLKDYLSLIRLTERQSLQDACWGILQNLTAHESAVSYVMSQIIVKKLNGIHYISPFLKSDKVNMQKSAMGLVVNLIKNPNLCSVVGKRQVTTQSCCVCHVSLVKSCKYLWP
uniref:Plakophilin 1 n=1 Tax=Poecilia reticulata TaxID=8081 RepID=A0A3P9P8M5_POERE